MSTEQEIEDEYKVQIENVLISSPQLKSQMKL